MPRRKLDYPSTLRAQFRWDSRASTNENQGAWANMVMRKADELFDHYSIDRKSPHRWKDLAILLIVHHPNLGMAAGKGGRKRDPYREIDDFTLMCEMGEAKRLGQPIAERAKHLTERKGSIFYGRNKEALRQLFYKLDNPKTTNGKRMAKHTKEISAIIEAKMQVRGQLRKQL